MDRFLLKGEQAMRRMFIHLLFIILSVFMIVSCDDGKTKIKIQEGQEGGD